MTECDHASHLTIGPYREFSTVGDREKSRSDNPVQISLRTGSRERPGDVSRAGICRNKSCTIFRKMPPSHRDLGGDEHQPESSPPVDRSVRRKLPSRHRALRSLPGAFTPPCGGRHPRGYSRSSPSSPTRGAVSLTTSSRVAGEPTPGVVQFPRTPTWLLSGRTSSTYSTAPFRTTREACASSGAAETIHGSAGTSPLQTLPSSARPRT